MSGYFHDFLQKHDKSLGELSQECLQSSFGETAKEDMLGLDRQLDLWDLRKEAKF